MKKTPKERMRYFKGQTPREQNVLEAALSSLMVLGVIVLCVIVMIIL